MVAVPAGFKLSPAVGAAAVRREVEGDTLAAVEPAPSGHYRSPVCSHVQRLLYTWHRCHATDRLHTARCGILEAWQRGMPPLGGAQRHARSPDSPRGIQTR